MELQNKYGFELIKTDELDKLKEIATFLPHVRSSVSKCWRLLDKFVKMLDLVIKQKEE